MCKVRLASPSIPAACCALLARTSAPHERFEFVCRRRRRPFCSGTNLRTSGAFDSYDEGILTRLIRVFVDARRGWRQVCTGNYENHAVPGSHLSMLRAPHVKETARRLRIVLERIDESMGAGD